MSEANPVSPTVHAVGNKIYHLLVPMHIQTNLRGDVTPLADLSSRPSGKDLRTVTYACAEKANYSGTFTYHRLYTLPKFPFPEPAKRHEYRNMDVLILAMILMFPRFYF